MTLKVLSEAEAQHWREGLSKDDASNELIAMGVMCAFTKPSNWLDVGCGTGAIARTASRNGIGAFGVDQLAETLHSDPSLEFVKHDLREPLDLHRTFEIVTCIEVVEHLEPEFEGVISDTLVRHVAPNGRLILTAAKPGQGGYNHFNCQPKQYWKDRMESRGLRYAHADTLRLAEIWKWTFTPLNHLPENLQVFTR